MFLFSELKRKVEKFEKIRLERNTETQPKGEVKDVQEPTIITEEDSKQKADSAKLVEKSEEMISKPSDANIQSVELQTKLSDVNIQSETEILNENQSEATTPSLGSQAETSSLSVTSAFPEKSTKISEKSSNQVVEVGDETVEVVDSQIQVDTLRFEEDASVQANTLNLNLLSPNPDSGVFVR